MVDRKNDAYTLTIEHKVDKLDLNWYAQLNVCVCVCTVPQIHLW